MEDGRGRPGYVTIPTPKACFIMDTTSKQLFANSSLQYDCCVLISLPYIFVCFRQVTDTESLTVQRKPSPVVSRPSPINIFSCDTALIVPDIRLTPFLDADGFDLNEA